MRCSPRTTGCSARWPPSTARSPSGRTPGCRRATGRKFRWTKGTGWTLTQNGSGSASSAVTDARRQGWRGGAYGSETTPTAAIRYPGRTPTSGSSPPALPRPSTKPCSIDALALPTERPGLWLRWQATPGPDHLAQPVGRVVVVSMDNAGEQANHAKQGEEQGEDNPARRGG